MNDKLWQLPFYKKSQPHALLKEKAYAVVDNLDSATYTLILLILKPRATSMFRTRARYAQFIMPHPTLITLPRHCAQICDSLVDLCDCYHSPCVRRIFHNFCFVMLSKISDDKILAPRWLCKVRNELSGWYETGDKCV